MGQRQRRAVHGPERHVAAPRPVRVHAEQRRGLADHRHGHRPAERPVARQLDAGQRQDRRLRQRRRRTVGRGRRERSRPSRSACIAVRRRHELDVQRPAEPGRGAGPHGRRRRAERRADQPQDGEVFGYTDAIALSGTADGRLHPGARRPTTSRRFASRPRSTATSTSTRPTTASAMPATTTTASTRSGSTRTATAPSTTARLVQVPGQDGDLPRSGADRTAAGELLVRPRPDAAGQQRLSRG